MKIEIEDGTFLGNGRIVVATEKHIKKYFFNPKVFPDIKKCTELMSIFHPDMFVDLYEGDYICVTMNRIDCLGDHRRDPKNQVGDYRSNIRNYLQLYKCFGNKICKRDLTPDNLLYRKSDKKFFIIDWDNITYFNDNVHCFNWYKEQLCDWRWGEWFELERNKIERIFEEEWKLITS